MRTVVAQFFAVALALLGVGILVATLPPAPAHGATADVSGIETSRHGVVRSSSLPHCDYEDGGAVVPCTWNVGAEVDGNGIGLAYVVLDHRGEASSFDYVWNTSPVRNGWHWSSVDSDCVVRSGHYRCADGAKGVN